MNDIKVKMSGKYKISLSPIGDKSVSFRSTGEDKELYDSICAENGDTSFNRDVTLIVDLINISSSYPDVASINVTSDKDFDAEHPAGTPLNDCLEVTFYSAYQYIQSGYNEDELSRDKQTKLLSEVSSTEFLLNTYRREFEFVKQPTLLGTHTITFSLTSVSGDVFEDSLEFDFK